MSNAENVDPEKNQDDTFLQPRKDGRPVDP